MTPLAWVLLACLIAYVTKLAGYLVPRSWLDSALVRRVSMSVTVGLLASLVVANAFASGQRLVLDARLAAVVAAVVALTLRAPFIVVVVAGALAAALARLMGAG